MTICSTDDCESPISRGDMCNAHYMQEWRAGRRSIAKWHEDLVTRIPACQSIGPGDRQCTLDRQHNYEPWLSAHRYYVKGGFNKFEVVSWPLEDSPKPSPVGADSLPGEHSMD